MTIALVRIDDRLIHGQVVVGWGQPLGAGFIVLVDDDVRSSDWEQEQELYRMGVPDGVEVIFASIQEATERMRAWEADSRAGIVLFQSIDVAEQLVEGGAPITRLNVGGIHHRPGRTERLRYVFLSDAEAEALRSLAAKGITVTAQDVPTARPVPLSDFA